jgi:hypothetical protein
MNFANFRNRLDRVEKRRQPAPAADLIAGQTLEFWNSFWDGTNPLLAAIPDVDEIEARILEERIAAEGRRTP